ncbi:MAG: endonuclease NucS domain-containing protein [Dehalococcoidia bacterium]
MPLFELDNGQVSKVDPQEFQNENALQNLLDSNLEDIFGVRLVDSQYNIPNGRIDALGIDDRNIPVVIEYKWKQDPGAIIQGLFYLDWLKKNRRTFEMLTREKLGRGVKVNWDSPPRLMIVAREFGPKELGAVNQAAVPVELWWYAYYGKLINVERATTVGSQVARQGKPKLEEAPDSYTVDRLLKNASPDYRKLYLAFREKVRSLGDEVWERVGKWYIDFRKSSTLA